MRFNHFRCDAAFHATAGMLKRIGTSVASGSVGVPRQRWLGREIIGGIGFAGEVRRRRRRQCFLGGATRRYYGRPAWCRPRRGRS